jgi:type IV pilus assembly protein PilY1
MKIRSRIWFCLFSVSIFLLPNRSVFADDTCIFRNIDTVKPNIVILLDSGAEMEQIEWHPDYLDSTDYTPVTCVKEVTTETTGDKNACFKNEKGYALVKNSGQELVKIRSDLEPANKNTGIKNNGSGGESYFTIGSRSNVFLPHTPSTVEIDGIIDNARLFRYSKNYLNWMFYHAASGITLPAKSRFYYAKQAILDVALQTDNRAHFGVYNFTNDKGASSVQPLKLVVGGETLDSAFIKTINTMKTASASPLAEGLATIGSYFNSPSSETVKAAVNYRCQDSFTIVVSAGVSSMDLGDNPKGLPTSLRDHDGDARDEIHSLTIDGVPHQIPLNVNGSTWLDDVAHYMANNDMVGYHVGHQPVYTYTVGVMSTEPGRRFLINTSNNGNNQTNLTDSSNPEYGKYHFDATSPEALARALMDAINAILERTNSFTAPVVPVTRTTSGNRIYLSFFKPNGGNFRQGNVVKFGLDASSRIVDKNGDPATYSNGSMIESALPYWATIDWADTTKPNGVPAADRNILTYLGEAGGDLTVFNATNITAALLGNPAQSYIDIIHYVRGADVLDEDKDGNTTENRECITGDVLHSEPLVYKYIFASDHPGFSSWHNRTMVFFGANDGMLHAVKDGFGPDEDGTEAWGFIPPHQLPRLKGMIEGTEHLYFVDASPKIYHDDINNNKVIDIGEKVILVCGERKGSNGYFALDVSIPDSPKYLWRINQTAVDSYTPLTVIPELSESWSNPIFGRVKTTDNDTTGTPVFFIGGGYHASNGSGKAVLVIDVRNGSIVKMFTDDATTDMKFSIASEVRILDVNNNGFIDKAYVGDMGGQMWRLGRFTNSAGTPLSFPASDENVNNWTAERIFSAGYSTADVPEDFFIRPA